WVVAHLVGESDGRSTHLAVAFGWAPDVAAAEAAIDRIGGLASFGDPLELEGRFMPPEGAVVPDGDQDPMLMQSMVPAHLVNLWTGVDGPSYSGYLVLHPNGAAGELVEEAGLDPIDSVAPEPPEAVNWLNV